MLVDRNKEMYVALTDGMKVGDKIHVCSYDRYMEGVITKVTPAGLVDVRCGEHTRRYKADGSLHGAQKWERGQLDNVSFDQRKAIIASEQRAYMARVQVSLIKAEVGRYSGKTELCDELDRLQGQIDAARQLIAEI